MVAFSLARPGRPGAARRPCLVLALVIVVAALATSPADLATALAETPALVDPVVAGEQRLAAGERGRDHATNPAAVALALQDCSGLGPEGAACGSDPYREPARWDGVHGTHAEASFVNRYGATLRGDLYLPPVPFVDPVTGEAGVGPFPLVLFLPGLDTARTPYRWAPQGFAQSGYIAYSFDPQGYGDSDTDPDPPDTFCDPDEWWTEPQEMGYVENGECAGQSGSSSEDVVAGQVVALALDDWETVQQIYVESAPQLVFGALDAVAWLLSPDSPVAGLVDASRVAIAGHSLGAYAAMMVANGDPGDRFVAAVGWDGYAQMDHGVTPRVPTMFQQSQQENALGPRVLAPDPQGLHPTRVPYAEFGGACVPATYVVLGASTHQEWAFQPFLEASRYGERVAFYFTLAWFDAFVKGAETNVARGDEDGQRDDALARLTATHFDASADRTSTGTGLFDPFLGGNVPYEIEGRPVEEHLSPYFATERDAEARCTAA